MAARLHRLLLQLNLRHLSLVGRGGKFGHGQSRFKPPLVLRHPLHMGMLNVLSRHLGRARQQLGSSVCRGDRVGVRAQPLSRRAK